LAKDSNSRARSDRHIKTDFSKAGLVATIKRTLKPTDAQFDQVSLDYMWMPNSYLHTSLGGTKGLTRLLEGLTQLVRVGGLVFFPFHIDVLVCLSANWETAPVAEEAEEAPVAEEDEEDEENEEGEEDEVMPELPAMRTKASMLLVVNRMRTLADANITTNHTDIQQLAKGTENMKNDRLLAFTKKIWAKLTKPEKQTVVSEHNL
jgi:hypothetical protein